MKQQKDAKNSPRVTSAWARPQLDTTQRTKPNILQWKVTTSQKSSAKKRQMWTTRPISSLQKVTVPLKYRLKSSNMVVNLSKDQMTLQEFRHWSKISRRHTLMWVRIQYHRCAQVMNTELQLFQQRNHREHLGLAWKRTTHWDQTLWAEQPNQKLARIAKLHPGTAMLTVQLMKQRKTKPRWHPML